MEEGKNNNNRTIDGSSLSSYTAQYIFVVFFLFEVFLSCFGGKEEGEFLLGDCHIKKWRWGRGKGMPEKGEKKRNFFEKGFVRRRRRGGGEGGEGGFSDCGISKKKKKKK